MPVLTPEQIDLPNQAGALDAQGRPKVGGGERGLGVYLQRHPQGYVQIEDPLPISAEESVAVFWCAVASFAATEAAAAALAAQVAYILAGDSLLPGPLDEVTPAQPRALASGAWLVRPTYQTLTIGGQHVAAQE
ncbi:hypothetical protein [uncultured Deinococcus sp.]|uniref:hypothetical protein n=1 Tax=uncultured Deinococcus sp. TaxID=158789 RepID=UPI00258BC1A9|nr:hypothetical protein [uncultured Deinococcus sp.]